ncbi:sensor domain-containing diguanylate cyclase [Marinomonas algicola]|uniref:sensor domain-containing diguanylate cyclase n=1 Tax=Marinomonas algicola TaxID=2773454 RepID=UPI00174AEC23|nr:sensor domain-containing diguanylate cyclase [Marinomonas algicola]
MVESYEFLKAVIDTITEHIVVIDKNGEILFVNHSWKSFGQKNSCLIDEEWSVNYLSECDKAAAMGDDFGLKAANGIRAVIIGDEENFYCEYPCHSDDEKRWFMMRVTSFCIQREKCFVISHQNITERKLAEEEVLNLSRIDGLTDIANRRYFNEFLEGEWKRCYRLRAPINLVIIDLDYFKCLNDTYGHQVGDACLKSVGKILKDLVRRPSDICARYGGEEFSIVYGNTTLEQAVFLAEKILTEIHLLKIPNENSPTLPVLTASIGVASMQPNKINNKIDLIKKTDELLYAAKENGRNQIFSEEF